MLLPLDNLLRDHLVAELPALTTPQVLFQPPDDDLATAVTNLNEMVLNIFLAAVRENRRLRTNERETVQRNGDVFSRQRPARLECQYLLSAWSPTRVAPMVEPTLDEHALLYDAVAVLMRDAPLNPSRVYPSGAPQLALWPEPFRDQDVPMHVAPPDGFASVGDFWNSMGQDARWKPTAHVSATIPVTRSEERDGPMVLTRFADYRAWDAPGSAEVLLQVGGHVRDAANPLPGGDPTPVAGATVGIENALGVMVATARTDADGRFTFLRLTEGNYVLSTYAPGRAVLTRAVDVPSPTGEYDLAYT